MELRFNVTGADRKALVQAISELMGVSLVYRGAPSFAFEVGNCKIDKAGTLSSSVGVDAGEFDRLIAGLKERGFQAEEEEKGAVVIEYPKDKLSATALANLKKIVHSKAGLIKKALGVDELPIIEAEEKVRFPWLPDNAAPELVDATSWLICAMLRMADSLKYVSAALKDVSNEKYAFRCFLLRLGMIGDEYKTTRKLLMANLEGNGSYKVVDENPA